MRPIPQGLDFESIFLHRVTRKVRTDCTVRWDGVDGARVGVAEPIDLLANSSGHRRKLAQPEPPPRRTLKGPLDLRLAGHRRRHRRTRRRQEPYRPASTASSTCPTAVKPLDLYRMLAAELGLRPGPRAQIVNDIKEALVSLVDECGIVPVIVLDDAQGLRDELLRELHGLTSLDFDGRDYLTVCVAAGYPGAAVGQGCWWEDHSSGGSETYAAATRRPPRRRARRSGASPSSRRTPHFSASLT